MTPSLSRPTLVLLAAGLASGCDGATAPPVFQDGSLRAELVVSGLSSPVWLTAPQGDTRLFIVEKTGRVRIVRNGALVPTPFLDLSSEVSGGSEQGLLGLAFHPRYAVNGLFYASYTDRTGDSRLDEFRVGGDPAVADPSSRRPILGVDQPFGNHNGGQVSFGPDGMLYVALGDGGGAGDPRGNGQDILTFLGSILRIDVDGTTPGGPPYRIPDDNPFKGVAAARAEIWAYGLRNPWRFAFDPPTGHLWIGDVGQNRKEEIDAVQGLGRGVNFGWNVMEGRDCFAASACERDGLTEPVLDYGHDQGCSVTGGYVYRGPSAPSLVGRYVYGDFCGGWVRSFRLVDGVATDVTDLALGDLGSVASFGVDAAGDLYVVSLEGSIFRIVEG